MRTLLTWTTALVFGLTTTSLALASGKGSSGSKGSAGSHLAQGSKQNFSPKHTPQLYSNHDKAFKHDKHEGYKYDTKDSKDHKHEDYKDYHLKHGKKLGKDSYCYPGKYHSHWKYCCFDKHFGCYLYCCPCTHCWYYFCVPDCCYYPVWYVPYRIYCWGAPVCYCTAPCPPEAVALPEPVEVVGPTE